MSSSETEAYRVRIARLDDASALARMRRSLQAHLDAANPYLFKKSDEAARLLPEFYQSNIQSPDARVVVVEHTATGAVIAMAMGRVLVNESLVPSRFGRIDDVWVEPDHRRHGLCRRMLVELARFFEQAAIQGVTLDYVVGNQEAQAVWPRLGFQPVLTVANTRLEALSDRLRAEYPCAR